MTSFILKLIGSLSMLIDHTGDAIIGKLSFLNFLGRFAFPIFAFQCVQGYINTKNLKKHIIKLLMFACISQIPFILFLSTFTNSFYLNIFFTFTLALLGLSIYDKCKNKIIGFIIIIITAIIAELIKVDYGAFAILLIFVFYFFKDKKILMSIFTIILCFLKYIPNILSSPSLWYYYILLGFFTASSLTFILFYNKKQGPKAKYFFYIFYPLHLIILYIIHNMALLS